MKGRSRRQEEEELEEDEEQLGEEADEKSFKPIELLLVNLSLICQQQGINQGDINKLSEAGFRTIEAVIYSTKKKIDASIK